MRANSRTTTDTEKALTIGATDGATKDRSYTAHTHPGMYEHSGRGTTCTAGV